MPVSNQAMQPQNPLNNQLPQIPSQQGFGNSNNGDEPIRTHIISGIETRTETRTESAVETDTETRTETETKSETSVETDTNTETKTESTVKTDTESETKTETKNESKKAERNFDDSNNYWPDETRNNVDSSKYNNIPKKAERGDTYKYDKTGDFNPPDSDFENNNFNKNNDFAPDNTKNNLNNNESSPYQYNHDLNQSPEEIRSMYSEFAKELNDGLSQGLIQGLSQGLSEGLSQGLSQGLSSLFGNSDGLNQNSNRNNNMQSDDYNNYGNSGRGRGSGKSENFGGADNYRDYGNSGDYGDYGNYGDSEGYGNSGRGGQGAPQSTTPDYKMIDELNNNAAMSARDEYSYDENSNLDDLSDFYSDFYSESAEEQLQEAFAENGLEYTQKTNSELEALKAELDAMKALQHPELMSKDEFLNKQKELEAAKEKKRRQKFRMVGSREKISASALEDGTFVAGKKFYKWGDTKKLDF